MVVWTHPQTEKAFKLLVAGNQERVPSRALVSAIPFLSI